MYITVLKIEILYEIEKGWVRISKKKLSFSLKVLILEGLLKLV